MISPESENEVPTRVRVGTAALWAGRAVGAALLVWTGWIHLHLWSEGYKHIKTIGPIFMVNFVVAMAIAVVLLAVPPRRLLALAAASGAMFALGTLGALVLSVNVGLFGFTESSNAPFAHLSLWVEAGATAVLLATAIGALLYRPAQELTPETLRNSSPTTGL